VGHRTPQPPTATIVGDFLGRLTLCPADYISSPCDSLESSSRSSPSGSASTARTCQGQSVFTGTNPPKSPFQAPLEKAELPPIRFHDLRHTCATILLMAGKHPKFVQELLGHASINITLDTYSHVIEGMDGGLADAMDEAL
jgi:Phage integrase family